MEERKKERERSGEVKTTKIETLLTKSTPHLNQNQQIKSSTRSLFLDYKS